MSTTHETSTQQTNPPRTVTTCGCRCHGYGGGQGSCDWEHDTGSSGVPNVPSCSPHDLADSRASAVAGVRASGDPCPGSCNREWRGLSLTEQENPDQQIRPVLGDPVWCEPCARRIDRALVELPDLYAHLEADFAARTSLPGEGKATKRPDAPSPSPQVDEQEALTAWATDLEDEIRAARGFTARHDPVLRGPAHATTSVPGAPALAATAPLHRQQAARELRQAQADLLAAYAIPDDSPDRASDGRRAAAKAAVVTAQRRFAVATVAPERRPATDTTLVRLTNAVSFVRGNLAWLLASEWAVDAGVEIQRRRGRLRELTQTDSGTRHFPRPCPRCDHKALRQQTGETHIECQSCGRLLTQREYDDLTPAAS